MPNVLLDTFGERLARARRYKNYKLMQDFADEVGVTRQTVSEWENDIRVPSKVVIIGLAAILDVDPEWLATGKVPLPQYPHAA